MLLMKVSHRDPQNGVRYTSHAHDDSIPRDTLRDRHERRYYAALRRTLQPWLRAPMHTRLLDERDWLERPPMDYATFVHFCSRSRDIQYRNPEVEGLDACDRRLLARRNNGSMAGPNHVVYFRTLDQHVYLKLVTIWIELLDRILDPKLPDRLPSQVRTVKVIQRLAEVSRMGLGIPDWMTDGLALISQRLDRLEAQGRIVYRGVQAGRTAIVV
ncbi:hypothetical protein LTR53_014041 [Teratosphaeriaceae sp. CCFEE 6253]|nr:hypothetical protein LTR53_014041 [Teratosphaeriaceae sp. CCFEE 6253]